MTVAAVRLATWQGCYADGWQDLIVQGAFSHPAKYARGLVHRIYRHLIEYGYVQEGAVVLDPFAGVGLGALDAMTYGLRWVGCEREPRFVALGEQNLALWRHRYGFTGGTIVQGDSRDLRRGLAGVPLAGCVVGSPPFGENPQATALPRTRTRARNGSQFHGGPGPDYYEPTTPGQLGAMPPGRLACVSSPPYAEGCIQQGHDYHPDRMVGTRTGYLQSDVNGYGTQVEPETFWAASAQIMTELAALLPPGAVCAWVLKAYVSKGAIVPFPDQWRQLCEAHGFTLCEEIHASLVEHHGTQEGLFSGPQTVTTEKKSFFRRLAERNGSPRIDHETILLLTRDGV